jgi:hypothetical protein
MDYNFLAQESLEWAIKSEQDLVLLFLNFEKAFDRIEWVFFFLALYKLGFSPKWIKWVSSLYWLASSSVKVNGESKKNFKLFRSVRQVACWLLTFLYWRRMSLDIC